LSANSLFIGDSYVFKENWISNDLNIPNNSKLLRVEKAINY